MNVLILWAAAEITGYQAGRWASLKQWQQIGAQVRRGQAAKQHWRADQLAVGGRWSAWLPP